MNELLQKIWNTALSTQSDIQEHLPLLRNLATGRQHVTEFGVRGICSAWAWLAAGVPNIRLYDLTHPKDYPIPGVPGYTWNDLVSIRPDVIFHKEDTRVCTIEPTELLFIDTLHIGSQVACGLERHHDKVSNWIVLHDTETYALLGEDGKSQGLDYGIIPFVDKYPWRIYYRTPNNNGLTILCRK